jgi:NAD(P)-dependent dehydrogenase (short-subunit alcohol dehydrogenase family)
MTAWRDQVALVTGGARGIGRATARLLAQRGAAVCVNYAAHADAADDLAAEIVADGGRAISAMADVAEHSAVEAMVVRIEKELGRVTILVNNAGVSWRGTLDTYDPEQVAPMRRVNVEGLIHATRAVIGGMRARRYGRIVNISSIAAIGTALPRVLCGDQGRGRDFDQTFRTRAWRPQHHRECGGAWICPNRYDATRTRRRRLAGN